MPFINGIGPGEIIIILIIALIVVGPGKLPDVGAALGKSIREFRKAATDVKESTSLDPTPTPTAPSPQAPHAPAPAAPVAPVAAVLPPASGAMNTAGIAVAAAEDPDLAPAPAAPAPVPAAEAWPEELSPTDEHQPTPSA